MGKTFQVSYITVISFRGFFKCLNLENKIEVKIEKGKLNSGPQNEEGD